MNKAQGGGYYSVLVSKDGGEKVPCIVFATSDWHAARIVRGDTGYMASPQEVEGPF